MRDGERFDAENEHFLSLSLSLSLSLFLSISRDFHWRVCETNVRQQLKSNDSRDDRLSVN